MTINFNRRKIETTCLLIAFILVILLTLTSIIAIADGIFDWNLFPRNIENIAGLLMGTAGVIIGATFLISLMANLSLMSSHIETIANKTEGLNGK